MKIFLYVGCVRRQTDGRGDCSTGPGLGHVAQLFSAPRRISSVRCLAVAPLLLPLSRYCRCYLTGAASHGGDDEILTAVGLASTLIICALRCCCRSVGWTERGRNWARTRIGSRLLFFCRPTIDYRYPEPPFFLCGTPFRPFPYISLLLGPLLLVLPKKKTTKKCLHLFFVLLLVQPNSSGKGGVSRWSDERRPMAVAVLFSEGSPTRSVAGRF